MSAATDFIARLLDQDDLGHAITQEVRDAARWALAQTPTESDVVYRLHPNHARLVLSHAAVTGAGRAALTAINKAGGHVICDPPHQLPVQIALIALENATRDALEIAAMNLEKPC